MKKIKEGNTIENMTEHPAKVVKYYDYDEDRELNCTICGWKGSQKKGLIEYYDELFDVSCPKCDKMILVVSYPTAEETKEAASKGNKEAQDEMPRVEYAEFYQKIFEERKLKNIKRLPEIEGEKLDFIFDEFKAEEDSVLKTFLIVEITFQGKVVWWEIGYYECWERFMELKELLKKKYGKRFHSLKPTPEARYYVYGDSSVSLDEVTFY